MAVQVHVAHSATVKGAGVLAGGPYYCAQGAWWTAYYNCMAPGPWTPLPSISFLHSEVEAFARAGRIDAPANLAGSRVWLFSGTHDRTVHPEVVSALRDFYASFKADTALVANQPAGHGMVVEDAKEACGATASPYLNGCHYDAAGELLKHLLGPLSAPAPKETGRLIEFDQNEFASGKALAISLDERGYAYVPAACETAECRVHIAFHGCRQGAAFVGDAFVRGAGYNRWADTNRLVIVYPQAVARKGASLSSWSFAWNPEGCWDWWGYAGSDYATKSGAQVRAVSAMVERLSAPR